MNVARVLFVGGSGHHSLRLLEDEADVHLQASFCPDPADPVASRAWRSRLGEAEDHDELEAALETFRPDVVSIGAVYAHNSRHSLIALRAGVPVVSDKPIAASEEALQELRSATRTPGARLVTEFDFRSRPEVLATRETIRRGELGELCLLVIQKSYRWGTRPEWYADRDLYTGTVLWIASHGIDTVRFLTGEEPSRCSGVGGNRSRPQWPSMEDHTVTLLDLPSGAHAVVHADLLRPAAAATHGDDRLRIVGSRGQIEIVDGQAWITTELEARRPLPIDPSHRSYPKSLLNAALGAEDPAYNTAESLATAELLLACRRAQDDGSPIAL